MKKLLYIAFFVFLFIFAFKNISLAQETQLPGNIVSHIPVCPPGPKNEVARCHARVVVDKTGKPQSTFAPSGYGPLQFQTAYNLLGTSASGRILAIVDAYDDPTVKNDLDTYSSQFGLPPIPTCSPDIATSVSPCFQKVDQNGGNNFPQADAGWALEISLDTQIARGVCPSCKILLIEANSSSYQDLMTGVDTAVLMNATAVSNSYGSNEFSGESFYDSHFNHPGIAFTFSSGDNGYGTSYPAASKYVTAVGGTSLSLNFDNTYNHETVWSGTGSGCSRYESKPSFQHDTGCLHRTIGDVAADADPNTGAAVYDTTQYAGQTGWFQVGGTSLASPLIASVYVLKGITSLVQANSIPYANKSFLHDITSGRNGFCKRSMLYLCAGVVGYDGPTGFGSPNGINAF